MSGSSLDPEIIQFRSALHKASHSNVTAEGNEENVDDAFDDS
jgi:hypothetical protein